MHRVRGLEPDQLDSSANQSGRDGFSEKIKTADLSTSSAAVAATKPPNE
jgi:hypothetical protein